MVRKRAAEYFAILHSQHSKFLYTSYKQTFVFFRASGCHVINGDSTQGQSILDVDTLVIYIAEAMWLGQKT